MPEREGFEGSSHQSDKYGDHGNDRLGPEENSIRNDQVPMSLDFSIFAARPPNRPTITR